MRQSVYLLLYCCAATMLSCAISQKPVPPALLFQDHDHKEPEPAPIQVPDPPISTPNMIYLSNPSFEDNPTCCTTVQGWSDCGAKGATPTDIQPGSFGVDKPPMEGQSYVSMVTRDNGSTECLYQKLPAPLIAGKRYSFSIQLAQAEYMFSRSPSTGKESDYDAPVKLQIGGQQTLQDPIHILAESRAISNEAWTAHRFELLPTTDCNYLILQVSPIGDKAVDGHLFLDACSPIQRIE